MSILFLLLSSKFHGNVFGSLTIINGENSTNCPRTITKATYITLYCKEQKNSFLRRQIFHIDCRFITGKFQTPGQTSINFAVSLIICKLAYINVNPDARNRRFGLTSAKNYISSCKGRNYVTLRSLHRVFLA